MIPITIYSLNTLRMPTMWNFQKQLRIGEQGEALLLERYREPMVLYSGRSADFRLPITGELVELKTDTYDRSKTSNFFMERWSVAEKKKPGGPWQARANSASRFIYLFASDGTYYEFVDVKALCAELDVLCKSLAEVEIKNR